MALLNYTTEVTAARSLLAVETMLVNAGAQEVTKTYRDGSVVGLAFGIETENGPRWFTLPVQTDQVLLKLQQQRLQPRYLTAGHAERVAWRILKDWLEAQLALISVNMASLTQVMLPYMTDDTGSTVYELFTGHRLELGTGRG